MRASGFFSCARISEKEATDGIQPAAFIQESMMSKNDVFVQDGLRRDQGWGIFCVGPQRYEVQKIDDPDETTNHLADDMAAAYAVQRQAARGEPTAVIALIMACDDPAVLAACGAV